MKLFVATLLSLSTLSAQASQFCEPDAVARDMAKGAEIVNSAHAKTAYGPNEAAYLEATQVFARLSMVKQICPAHRHDSQLEMLNKALLGAMKRLKTGSY